MNIIFFGSSSYVLPIIEVLHKNFDIKLVLTTERPALAKAVAGKPKANLASQGETLRSYLQNCPVVKYCIENNIPYCSVQQFNNLTIQQLQKINATVGVLADFGLIIPQKILNLFPKGIINIHPSLLPKYRGPTPVQTAILNGDKITGVSIMKLDGKIDHGQILAQEKEEILNTDTAETLYKRLFAKGANLLSNILSSYLEDRLKPTSQNHENATFTKPLKRADGFIDLSSQSLKIKNLKLKIRAFYPWPGVWTELRINDKLLRIKLLPENKLQVEGKKPVSYKDFLNGYPDAESVILPILK